MAKVVLPVENKNRELDGKTWLAANLADRGHSVVMGHRMEIESAIDLIKPDIAIIHTASGDMKDTFLRWHNSGIDLYVLETEGAIFKSDEHFLKKKCSKSVLDIVKKYFSWGKRQKKLITKSLIADNKVVVTGNPRFDLTKKPLVEIYSKRSKDINQRFGDYLLINTNFGVVNLKHVDEKDRLIKRIMRVYQQTRAQAEDIFKKEKYLLCQFVELAEYLYNNGHQVIVRPHPMEKEKYYNQNLNEDIIVSNSGDAREWIYGANAVIHNGSTTGVEAAMMNKSVCAFCPIKIDSRSTLPNRVSSICQSKEGVLKQIKCDQYANNGSTQRQNELYNNFNYFSKEASAKIITEEIEQVDQNNHFDMSSLKQTGRLKKIIKSAPGANVYRKLNYAHIKKDRIRVNDIQQIVKELPTVYENNLDIFKSDNWYDIYTIRSNGKNVISNIGMTESRYTI